MDARSPKRLVCVDVAHAGDSALVEQRGLDGRATVGESRRERRRTEAARERLRTDARVEVCVEFVSFDQQPRPEPAYIAVGDVLPVV
jgi:hypothetical protein